MKERWGVTTWRWATAELRGAGILARRFVTVARRENAAASFTYNLFACVSTPAAATAVTAAAATTTASEAHDDAKMKWVTNFSVRQV